MGGEILRYAQNDSQNFSQVRSREPYLQTSEASLFSRICFTDISLTCHLDVTHMTLCCILLSGILLYRKQHKRFQ